MVENTEKETKAQREIAGPLSQQAGEKEGVSVAGEPGASEGNDGTYLHHTFYPAGPLQGSKIENAMYGGPREDTPGTYTGAQYGGGPMGTLVVTRREIPVASGLQSGRPQMSAEEKARSEERKQAARERAADMFHEYMDEITTAPTAHRYYPQGVGPEGERGFVEGAGPFSPMGSNSLKFHTREPFQQKGYTYHKVKGYASKDAILANTDASHSMPTLEIIPGITQERWKHMFPDAGQQAQFGAAREKDRMIALGGGSFRLEPLATDPPPGWVPPVQPEYSPPVVAPPPPEPEYTAPPAMNFPDTITSTGPRPEAPVPTDHGRYTHVGGVWVRVPDHVRIIGFSTIVGPLSDHGYGSGYTGPDPATLGGRSGESLGRRNTEGLSLGPARQSSSGSTARPKAALGRAKPAAARPAAARSSKSSWGLPHVSSKKSLSLSTARHAGGLGGKKTATIPFSNRKTSAGGLSLGSTRGLSIGGRGRKTLSLGGRKRSRGLTF